MVWYSQFTLIPQRYFTGTYDCLSASEATLKNMGKLVISTHYEWNIKKTIRYKTSCACFMVFTLGRWIIRINEAQKYGIMYSSWMVHWSYSCWSLYKKLAMMYDRFVFIFIEMLNVILYWFQGSRFLGSLGLRCLKMFWNFNEISWYFVVLIWI